MKAYLELAAQPASKMPYTERDDTAIIKRRARLRSANAIPLAKGILAHAIILKVKLMQGANINKDELDELGTTLSFSKSLSASEKGWSRP
jgi:hypothetical protein